VVASTVPHAVGAALAARRRGLDQIAVAVFGDGATEQGCYHESLNFAALHRLPVLFLCENNGLAVHSHRSARQSYEVVTHARGYGIHAVACEEGWDFMRVRAVVAEAAETIRAGAGPVLVECRTERYMEHVGVGEDYDAGYRSRAAAERWKAHDPLLRETELVARFTPAITAEIDAAVAFAETSPWPDAAALLRDVA
jgi:pyruvate dehydrogenase E1 component alpha subunit